MAIDNLNQASNETGLARRECFCPRPDQPGSNRRLNLTWSGDEITQIDLRIQEVDGTETHYQIAGASIVYASGHITRIGPWVKV
jgi:hypothetical protein